MRQLMRMHLVYAAILFALAIIICAYYWIVVQTPSFDRHSAAFHDSVTRISDPEHLKRVVFTVTKEAESFAITAKRTVDAVIVFLAIVLCAAGSGFLHTYFSIRRLQDAPKAAGTRNAP